MSPQSASRGPVERVYVERIHGLDTEQLAASVGGLGRTSDDLCLIFGIPSWLMPLRDRSGQRWQPSGKPYVVAATKVCSRSIGTCRALSPPSPPSLPLSFFAFWGFPECNTQDHPSLSWVCPWTIIRSWEHLPFLSLSLSLSLSFLLSFLSSPSSLGVPGCFVIAGSPSFWCVPGRMCRSWEHLCLFLSFPLFSSSPCPLFPHARRVYKQTRLLQQVFLMRFGLSSVCPRSFGSPFIGPHRPFFSSFLSCLSVFMSLHPHPFFLLRALSSGP